MTTPYATTEIPVPLHDNRDVEEEILDLPNTSTPMAAPSQK